MKSLVESLFDSDLIEKDLPVKSKYVAELEALLKKYKVEYRVHNNTRFGVGTESYIIDLDKTFKNALQVKGKVFDYNVFIHPEVAFPTDENLDRSQHWKVHPSSLWFSIVDPNSSVYISSKLQTIYNNYLVIPSSTAAGDFEKNHDLWKKYLKRLEEIIKNFNSKSFDKAIDDIISEKFKGDHPQSEPIRYNDLKKLINML